MSKKYEDYTKSQVVAIMKQYSKFTTFAVDNASLVKNALGGTIDRDMFYRETGIETVRRGAPEVSIEEIHQRVSKYNTLSELRKADQATYLLVLKHQKLGVVFDLVAPDRNKWSVDNVSDLMWKFATITEFNKYAAIGAVSFYRKNMEKFDIDAIFGDDVTLAQSFETTEALQEFAPRLYSKLVANGDIAKVFPEEKKLAKNKRAKA